MRRKKQTKQTKANMIKKVRGKKDNAVKSARRRYEKSKAVRFMKGKSGTNKGTKRNFGSDLDNVPLAKRRDTDHSILIKMENPKELIDTIQLPNYVTRSTKFFEAVEEYIISHYSFLRSIPGIDPIVDAYDDINKCYVDIKVTTGLTTGRSVLTSSGQMNQLKGTDNYQLKDKENYHNLGYYLIIRSAGNERGMKNMYNVELLLAVPEDNSVDDQMDEYVPRLKNEIKKARSGARSGTLDII